MKIPTIIRYYIKRIESLSLNEAKTTLIELGFHKIGSGCESVVYSRKGFEWVIKLTYSPHAANSIDTIRKNPSDKHFAFGESFPTTHDEFFIVIQKKVTPLKFEWTDKKASKRFDKWIKMIEKKFPNISDLIKDNVGTVNGRMVCLDWCDNG
jgi:hypothetical protein